MTIRTTTLVIAAALVTIGCGGGSNSPTAPTPPAPPPVTLTFQSDYESRFPNVFHLSDRGETTPGQIALNVNATFVNRGFQEFRGTILFDTQMLEVISYSEGPYMLQGGVLAQFSVAPTNGGISLRVTRATSATTSAGGDGVVLVIRFRPRDGVRAGVSVFQWTNTSAIVNTSTNQLSRTFGGTMTIR